MQYQGKTLRHEQKYYINYAEYHYLRARLEEFLRVDKNAEPGVGYHIRSLYFDDMYNSAMWEKEQGVYKRHKYRIRVYNKSDQVIRLERKEKFGEYISKTSVPLTREQVETILRRGDLGFMLDFKKEMATDFFIETKAMLLRPVVVVDYQREVYIMDEGNVRITFDKELQAGVDTCNLFDPDMIVLNAMPENQMVLEVKYDDFCPKIVERLLKLSRHERCAISKYVICRKAQQRAGFYAQTYADPNRFQAEPPGPLETTDKSREQR